MTTMTPTMQQPEASTMSDYGICPWCGDETVLVDNPWRHEVRHRRGQGLNCPGAPPIDPDWQPVPPGGPRHG